MWNPESDNKDLELSGNRTLLLLCHLRKDDSCLVQGFVQVETVARPRVNIRLVLDQAIGTKATKQRRYSQIKRTNAS